MQEHGRKKQRKETIMQYRHSNMEEHEGKNERINAISHISREAYEK